MGNVVLDVYNAAVTGEGRAEEGEGAPEADRGGPAGDPQTQRIGEILRETKGLSEDQVSAALEHQREKGLRFGEAAIQLGLVSVDDVLGALSRQYRYPYAQGEVVGGLGDEVVVAHKPFSQQSEAFRQIRSQLLQRWTGGEGDSRKAYSVSPPAGEPKSFSSRIIQRLYSSSEPRRAIAVVSPNSGDGKTFFAANLAVSLSQLGGRVLVIDADMRNPRMHAVFGVGNAAGLSSLLSGRTRSNVIQQVPGFENLFVLPVGNVPPNPAELVERPEFAMIVAELSGKFDYTIVDTPAAVFGPDASVIAAKCGAALVVARRDVSRVVALQELVASLSPKSVRVASVVMNEY